MEIEPILPASKPRKTTKLVDAEVSTLIRLTILICIMLLITHICSAQIKSLKSGLWTSPSTWVGGVVPQSGSAVEIAEGHQVTINTAVSCSTLELIPPPNNDKDFFKSELILENGSALTANSIYLNSKTDRRYASLINNGAIIALSSLSIGKGSIVENLAGTITVSNTLLNEGSLTTNAAILKVGGTFSGAGTFTKGNGIVEYTSSATQNIANIAYHHLQLSGNNTKSPVANLSVSGNLQIASGTTFKPGIYTHSITGDVRNNGTLISETTQPASITIGGSLINNGTTSAGAATYYINGHWNNAGTFQAGTSTIVLQGSTLQQISGNNTFYNLQFTGSAQAQLLQDVSITNSFAISNSHLQTGANALLLGTAAAITSSETDAAHVIGSVRTSRTLTPAQSESFGNIGLTLTRNEVDPGVITVERVTGVTTEISSGKTSVTRQYNISRSGTNDISALSLTMDLTFLPTELEKKPLDEFELYNKGQDQAATPVASTIVNQSTMRHTNSNRFGTYTLAPASITPLPVELVWFKVSLQNQVAVLQWRTASEQDNSGFEVQVSLDGNSYRTLAFIPSKSPDSRVEQQYSFTDSNPDRSQKTYYRLKQIDYSGKISYSKTQVINFINTPFIVQAVPNPFKEFIKFTFNAPTVQVTLTDLNGKPVLQQHLSEQDRTEDGYFKLNTTTLNSKSIYLLTIQTADQVHKTKLLKQ